MCFFRRIRVSCAALLLAFGLIALGALPTSHADDYIPSRQPTGATQPIGASFQPGAVRQVAHQEQSPGALLTTGGEKPLLLPARPGESSGEKSTSGPRTMGAIVSVAASLAIVLGLFFVITWLMRRTLPNASRKLPSEVVDILGRTPLAGRQQMHLLRFGNKLLLVCVSPAGVNTLAEITDPTEIDRVISLCGKAESSSANKSFKQILGQLAGDKLPQLSRDGNRKTSLPFSSRSSAVAEEAADV